MKKIIKSTIENKQTLIKKKTDLNKKLGGMVLATGILLSTFTGCVDTTDIDNNIDENNVVVTEAPKSMESEYKSGYGILEYAVNAYSNMDNLLINYGYMIEGNTETIGNIKSVAYRVVTGYNEETGEEIGDTIFVYNIDKYVNGIKTDLITITYTYCGTKDTMYDDDCAIILGQLVTIYQEDTNNLSISINNVPYETIDQVIDINDYENTVLYIDSITSGDEITIKYTEYNTYETEDEIYVSATECEKSVNNIENYSSSDLILESMK